MEKYFEQEWPEIEDDHVEPYDYVACGVCEGAIKAHVDYAANVVTWKHLVAADRDHAAQPVSSFDMVPPSTIYAAVGHIIEYYYAQ